MLVAIDLAPSLKLQGREDDSEDDGDDHGIWPSPKKPCLLPSPWQSLPLDLLFHSVLVRLPFPVLLKLRSVSRSWRQRLSSHDFWLLWFQGITNPNHNPNPNPNPNSGSCSVDKRNPYHVLDSLISSCGAKANDCRVPCFLLCSAQPKASPGCQATHWLRQSAIRYVQQQDGAAAICRHPQYWSQLHESFMQMQEPYILLASDGGLLLLATRSEQSRKLIVCNPLLSTHKVIRTSEGPPSTDMPFMSVGFIVDKQCGEYRVFLFSRSCQVYSSSTGKWRLIPTELPKDADGASPPILEGSYFWLSHQQNSSHEITLFAYHADAHVVTCVRTRFPEMVSFPRVSYPNRGRVWKDSNGLHTLAWRSLTICTWKLDNGLWKYEKGLSLNPWEYQLSTMRDYVKVDDLLLLRFPNSKQVYVFNCGLEQGCWTPCCADAEYLTGHCVFQPSCIRV